MSQHDLVRISSNLQCLHNSPAALNAVAYIVCVKQFVMSLLVMSLGDWFSVSRKDGTGEVGWYIHPKVKTAWLCVSLAVKKTLSRVITRMVLQCSSVIY